MSALPHPNRNRHRVGAGKRLPNLRILMFKSLITCEGVIADENPQKIRFRQDWVDCWIKRSDIKKLTIGLKTPEGGSYCKITLSEELANLMELQGELE
jgi:hypothetical protein